MFTTKTESSNAWPTSAERERHDDRDDGEDERNQPRDESAENEKQHDERRRDPEEELSRAQVVLGELLEVGVERPLARDSGLNRGLGVELLDRRHDILDGLLGRLGQADQ